jgi:methionyl aminopeptidase
MAIPIRSPREIGAIARSAGCCERVLLEVASHCVEGAITADLDRIADAAIRREAARPIFRGYGATVSRAAFTGAMCVSINEELVHGVPGERLVRPGDVVSLDVGLELDGWCADCATTVLVDTVDPKSERLRRDVLDVLHAAMDAMRPGVRWSQVVAGAGRVAAERGIRLVEPYAGHGVGRSLHEPPRAPLLNTSGGSSLRDEEDFVLRPGMVLTIEPIGVRGSGQTVTAPDGWTVLASDRAIGCHEERMVAIVRGGCRALTSSLERGA